MKKSSTLIPIRSFVRREGRITPAQLLALETLWPKYGLEIIPGGHLWCENAVLEIGFGMGDSLLLMAKARPDMNFIGVEVHRPGVGKLLAEIEKHQLHNVRLFKDDVVNVLNQSIKDNSLSKTQIYFPDPWPKQRHHKRRLIQSGFIELLSHKLRIGGYLHLATDWQDYAEHMMLVMSQAAGFENCAGEGQYIENQNLRPITKFEQRGCKLGHGVWDLLFKLVAHP